MGEEIEEASEVVTVVASEVVTEVASVEEIEEASAGETEETSVEASEEVHVEPSEVPPEEREQNAPIYREIQDGLQLWVLYKNAPSVEDTKEQIPGFHSRHTRPTGAGADTVAHILLFTDIESLEAAKVKLSEDEI